MKLLFMGSQALAEGFNLLGFETFPEATHDTVEQQLSLLLKEQERAIVFLENHLAQQPGPAFLRARSEAAGIIITELPPLNAPDSYRPSVEELVMRVLGPSVLDNSK
jgi:vacuolar-type H+-ATPase subunit F/Vma7